MLCTSQCDIKGWSQPGDSDKVVCVRITTMGDVGCENSSHSPGPEFLLFDKAIYENPGSIEMSHQNPQCCPSSLSWGITLTGALSPGGEYICQA